MPSLLPFWKNKDIQRLRGLAQRRIFLLNNKQDDPTGDYVLYWMQMTQRTTFNFALEFAIEQANKYRVPLVVYHGLDEEYPYASDRIHTFILQGVKELYQRFKKLGINYGFYLVRGKRKPAVDTLLKKAVCLVSDDYPSFVIPEYNARIAERSLVSHYVVDSCTVASMRFFEKQEWSAASIRVKIRKVLAEALEDVVYPTLLNKKTFDYPEYFLQPEFDVAKEVSRLSIDHSIKPSTFKGGESAAQEHLTFFLHHNLDTYDFTKDDPTLQRTSHLSAYLHFGMISPIAIARQVLQHKKLPVDRFLKSLITPDAVSAYLEQLIVRRDLAYNFCHCNKKHATYQGIPKWAKVTLREHKQDARPYIYTKEQLERAQTHDPYWNAAQLELAHTGTMHGFMRMYWCKQLLIWTKKPQDAFKIAIYLNDKYALDGRDPNGYTGIAWALGGLHDRPWFTKPIFGKIRLMNMSGLARKYNMQRYLAAVEKIMPDTNSRKP